jgi:hypothetical protein
VTGAAENKKDDKVAAENVTIGFDDGENDGDTTENPFDNIDIASDTDFAFSVFVEGSSAESGDDEDYGQMLFDEDHLGGSLINFTSSNGDAEGASADNVSSIAIVPTDSPVASEVTTTAQHITETTQSTTPIVVSVNDPTTTIKVSNRAIVTTFLPFIVFTAILIVLLRLGKLFIDLLTI